MPMGRTERDPPEAIDREGMVFLVVVVGGLKKAVEVVRRRGDRSSLIVAVFFQL
jgi:hypothetical protein